MPTVDTLFLECLASIKSSLRSTVVGWSGAHTSPFPLPSVPSSLLPEHPLFSSINSTLPYQNVHNRRALSKAQELGFQNGSRSSSLISQLFPPPRRKGPGTGPGGRVFIWRLRFRQPEMVCGRATFKRGFNQRVRHSVNAGWNKRRRAFLLHMVVRKGTAFDSTLRITEATLGQREGGHDGFCVGVGWCPPLETNDLVLPRW